jgi:multidrug efflux pump subunit AcrB
VDFVGFSAATFTNAPNSAAIFLTLAPWEQRAKDPNQSAAGITRALSGKFASIQDALILVIQPPPVSGIGNAGGFRMMVEDRGGRGPQALQAAALALTSRANARLVTSVHVV